MAITSAISDLFSSIYELFASVFGAIYAVFASIVNAVFSFVNGIFTLAGDVLGGFIDVTTGLGKFIVGKNQIQDENKYLCALLTISSQATLSSSPSEPWVPLSMCAIPLRVNSWRIRRRTKEGRLDAPRRFEFIRP